MNLKNFGTEYVKKQISDCKDVECLRDEILPMLKSQQEMWAQKVNEIICENGYTKKEFSELCKVSRVTVDKCCKGSIPKNRENFLRIGLAANYDLDKMNQLLQRYGQYPALYPKSLEDCACIFVIENHFGTDKYFYILNRIKENIIRDETAEAEDVSTMKFHKKLSEVKDEDSLEQFITSNIAIFSSAYHKFYAYVKMFIEANYQRDLSSVYDMAVVQGWSSSLRQCVSAIRQNKWYPTRNKIISLGLHLSMDHEQVDKMLELAHMEPLYAKNIFESVIIFILDTASLNNIFDTESDEFDPDELCKYARKILSELDYPEMDTFISELAGVYEDE